MSLPTSDPYDAARTLTRVEVKVDQLLADANDHEGRLRALEARNWPRQSVNTWIAACAALAAISAVVEGIFIR